MAWLTKSRFLSGLQCHKRLWFEIHQPLEEAVEPGMPLLQGRAFDLAVQGLLPGAIVSREAGLPAAIAETKRVLAKGGKAPAVIHQAAFRAGNLAVITDVLRRAGATFELVEVKSSTAVKKTHLPDAAFQALVLQRAKVPVGRVFIGLVNNQFVLRRMGDYEGLLALEDVTDPVRELLAETAAQAVELQEVMASETIPVVSVGPQCMDPYECPFLARCTAGEEVAEYPVEVLPRGGELLLELLGDGIRDLRDVPVKRLTDPLHRRVYDATQSGLAFFDRGATAALRALPSPFAYLDFETMGFAVPEVIGTRPYEQLPFQWSVHVERSASDVRHFEYLAVERFGEFGELAGSLLQALPAAGPVFSYNASFEARVLERLAALVPGQEEPLRAVAARLVDLLPVTRAAYYHRDMRGSWSIKAVMPTIDASLAYASLDEVQAGDSAQLAFLELRRTDLKAERQDALKKALLRYCRHDTWVMVVLRRFLCGEELGLAARA